VTPLWTNTDKDGRPVPSREPSRELEIGGSDLSRDFPTWKYHLGQIHINFNYVKYKTDSISSTFDPHPETFEAISLQADSDEPFFFLTT
jgi:hypothetical protein